MFNTNIKSMLDLIRTFPDEQSCIDYLEQIRWAGNVISPFDANSKVYKCKGNKYKCKATGKYFNVRTGTMYDNSKMDLQKWFLAVWLVTSHKKGISSLQLGRDLSITQKSAWFMLIRIRACFGIENDNDLEGTIECDESFYGGKNINRHKDKKVEKCQGRSFKDKVPIMGMIQRRETETIVRPHKVIDGKTVTEKKVLKHSKLNAFVIPNTQKTSIQPLIKEFVKEGSRVITDEWIGYRGLSGYKHDIIDHSKKEYVNADDPTMHTNSIEGSWKIMKNSFRDMYNHVSKKHLQLYVDEHVYRYNMRQHPDSDKFNWLIANNEVRTKYKDIIK